MARASWVQTSSCPNIVIACDEYKELISKEDPEYVPYNVIHQYGQLFNIIAQRYKQNGVERSLALQQLLNRYASISLSAEMHIRRFSNYLLKLPRPWMTYFMNRSCQDENKAFLTTADSQIKLLSGATQPVSGWKGLEYRPAFPFLKPPVTTSYPPDKDKKKIELWKDTLTKEQKQLIGFLNVIIRHNDDIVDHVETGVGRSLSMGDLYCIPYSEV